MASRAGLAAGVLALALAGCDSPQMPEFRSPIVFRSEPARASQPPRTSSAASRPTIAVAYVGDQSSNLRAGPGMSYAIVGGAAPGTRLEVVGQRGGWLEVRNGSRTAWIAERLIRSAAAVAVPVSPGDPADDAPPPVEANEPASGDGILPDF